MLEKLLAGSFLPSFRSLMQGSLAADVADVHICATVQEVGEHRQMTLPSCKVGCACSILQSRAKNEFRAPRNPFLSYTIA